MKEETWSVCINRARQFFREQEDMVQTGLDQFAFGSCKITLKELMPREMGIWAAKRIQIHMEGRDDDVSEAYHRFFIQFLSAGG